MTPAETQVHRALPPEAQAALPPEAQAALALCPGPGYLVRPDGTAVPMVACPGLPVGFGWCPSDTAEILAVCKTRAASLKGPYVGDLHLFQFGGQWCAVLRFLLPGGMIIHPKIAEATPRLAALRLLAAVWSA